jgi:hypothetical protein
MSARERLAPTPAYRWAALCLWLAWVIDAGITMNGETTRCQDLACVPIKTEVEVLEVRGHLLCHQDVNGVEHAVLVWRQWFPPYCDLDK